MTRRSSLLYLLLLSVAILFASCSTGGQNDQFTTVDPAELEELLDSGDIFLVKVSSGSEQIPGTDLVMSDEDILADISVLPGLNHPTAVYCEAGPASRAFVNDLTALGFTDIIWLDGGIRGWKKDGRPVEKR